MVEFQDRNNLRGKLYPVQWKKIGYVSKRDNSEYLSTYYLRIIIIVEFVVCIKEFFFLSTKKKKYILVDFLMYLSKYYFYHIYV